MSEKICPQCGCSFEPDKKDQVFCNELCYLKNKTVTIKLVERKCLLCGKTFTVHGSSIRNFCSSKCGNYYRRHNNDKLDYKENHDRITEINNKALALGLSYGMYKAYLSMGMNPANFARVWSKPSHEF